jgi:translation initiation factor 4G
MSSAIKILDPATKTEIKLPLKVGKSPEQSPSPPAKPAIPVKSATSRTHTPALSVDVEMLSSWMAKSTKEVAEEMRAQIQQKIDDDKKARAEKEEAEQRERENKAEAERWAKQEIERLERERKEEEERKAREEERIKLELEKVERKAEEERVAAQKAKEEEYARIAKEKAEEEAALEASRLAEEKEEEERKAREDEERIKLELEKVERKAEEERVAAQKAKEEEHARIAKEKAEEEAALEASRLAEEKEEAEAKAKAKEAIAMEEPVVIPTPAEATSAVLEEDEVIEVDEQIPSLGKTLPPIATTSDNPVIDGHQYASLKTASFIKQDDFLSTKYPSDVTSPDPSINANFGSKGFHYDMDFLLQFKDIYMDIPRDDWDSIIKDTMGDSEEQNPRPVDTTRVSSLPPMGQFIISSRPAPELTRLPSAPTTSPSSPGRLWSKPQRDRGNRRRQPPPPPPPPPAELPVEPLAPSANRWKPTNLGTNLDPPPGAETNKLTPEVVQRKVKSLLNKLTLEKFDKITDQIVEIASQSKYETDGRTLRQIISLVFDKATDEPTFSEMYAKFCRKIMETINPSITDPTIVSKDGQPLTGGQLFRKYLLTRCQEEFERGWKINLPPKPDENATGKEVELLSDEYYIAAKAKRQGLGLVQFIGELFKLNMLIEKAMYGLHAFH